MSFPARAPISGSSVVPGFPKICETPSVARTSSSTSTPDRNLFMAIIVASRSAPATESARPAQSWQCRACWGVGRPEAEVRFAAGLRVFLAPRHRGGRVRVACDGTSTLGHVVESLGVPLPEVGSLVVNGRPAAPGYRPGGGDVIEVGAMRRPQRLPSERFILDVHLGTVARRLRRARGEC